MGVTPPRETLSVVGGPGGRWRGWLRRAPRLAYWLVLILFLAVAGGIAGVQLRGKPLAVPKNRFSVVVLNVGQGEASIVRTASGKFVIIGGGLPGEGAGVVNALRDLGATRVDLLILPYPYAEAIGGIPDVVRAFPIGQAVVPGGPSINQWQRQIQNALEVEHVPQRIGHAGQVLEQDGVKIEFLAPPVPPLAVASAAANNSLVIRMTWGNTHFLWAGGIEAQGEEALLASMPELRADWLRVAHFGTRNASSPEFLRLVSPEFAVVSVGPNQDGFPSVETLSRLIATGAKVYRTDQQAAPLRFYSDGNRVYGAY